MKTLVYIGSDHGGYTHKQKIIAHLKKKGHAIIDKGVSSSEKSSDYPDQASLVAKEVAEKKTAKGILICGTGIGMTIAANKVKGIRAAMAYDTYSAKMSRQHNNANILTLKGRKMPLKNNLKIVDAWLKEPFSDGLRHKRRIKKIAQLERDAL
ncbi:ribose 5-phosphate isomerase B [Candidatus Woesearchaeota archaeon]|nr:ribose 5-phosphate isomerase B [Candidatus Woesearchaeota archaeon]